MNDYPLLSRKNISAYFAVMAAWIVLSVLVSLALPTAGGGIATNYLPRLILSLVAVMAGMMIMFVASAINLRSLRPGFRRLAQGESDPQIPRVWCPVLTMATKASLELSQKLNRNKGE